MPRLEGSKRNIKGSRRNRARSPRSTSGGALLPSATECRDLFRRKQISGRKFKKYSMCKWLRSRDYLDFKNEGKPQRDYGMLSFMSAARRSARRERNKYRGSMKREAALYGDAMHADDNATERELKGAVKAGILTPTQAYNLRNQPAKLRLMSLLRFPETNEQLNVRMNALKAGVEEDLRSPTATLASITAAAQRKGHLTRIEVAHTAEQARRRAMQN